MSGIIEIADRLRAAREANPYDFRNPSMSFLFQVDPELKADFDALSPMDQDAAIEACSRASSVKSAVFGSAE